MTEPSQSQSARQALRLKRFLIASSTYALGLLIMALCSALGLIAIDQVLLIGLVFLVVNVALFTMFRSGLNLRFADPSLTRLQVLVGVTMVALILVLGARIHFLAVPFYSVVFVFAMLQLKPRELVGVEIYVLVTYALAIAIRRWRFAGLLDPHNEAIEVVLVVFCSAWYAMAAGYIGNLRARLRESVKTIEQLAIRDALTDTWNRRHIDALLSAELQRKMRTGGALCACLVDLDHFKSINDRFGHLVGDAVLRRVAQTLKAELRFIDQLGRFGGEEFLIVLPGASLDDAEACAERLLRSVASLALLADPDDRVTVSIGVAECEGAEEYEPFLARVDAALYQAKRAGRNRVAIGAQRPTIDHAISAPPQVVQGVVG